MTPPNDDQIRFIRPLNKEDVEALIGKYHPQLKLVASSMLRRAGFRDAEFEADDLLQKIYIAIWIKGINNANSLDALLMAMVRNKVVDRIRIRSRRPQVPLDETMEDVRIDLEREFETKDLVERVFSEMAPENQQILQEFSAGDSGKEIAQSRDIPENTARSKLFRAKLKFKKIFFDKVKKENPQ